MSKVKENLYSERMKNNEIYDAMYRRVGLWLNEFGATHSDLMTDEDGKKYIVIEEEMGTPPEEDYEVREVKVYVPEEFLDKEYYA